MSPRDAVISSIFVHWELKNAGISSIFVHWELKMLISSMHWELKNAGHFSIFVYWELRNHHPCPKTPNRCWCAIDAGEVSV